MAKAPDGERRGEALRRLKELRSEVTAGREKARSQGRKLVEKAAVLQKGVPKRHAS
jgi:hypothetical protein